MRQVDAWVGLTDIMYSFFFKIAELKPEFISDKLDI